MKILITLSLLLIFSFHCKLYAEGDGYGITDGGNNGETVTVSTLAEFQTYAGSSQPYIIKINGIINVGTGINIASNKTISGVDISSTIVGVLNIKNVQNVIVKYLKITNTTGDGITIRQSSHIYVTHCTVYDCSDGCIDVTVESDFVTISYCRFYYVFVANHKFVNLVGASDDNITDRGKLHVTFHHNWWDKGCAARMPLVRFGRVHMYNNYFSCKNNQYSSRSRFEAQILSEYNYYDSIRDPFTAEEGGIAKSIGNYYYKCYNVVYPGNDSVFSPDYSYTTTTPECAKKEVLFSAGNTLQDKTFKASLSLLMTGTEPYIIAKDSLTDQLQYSWSNADSVIATGLPSGVTVKYDRTSNIVNFEGSPNDTGTYIINLTAIGCADSVSLTDTIIIVDHLTGIDKYISDNKNVLIYPNPSGSYTYFSLSKTNDKIKNISVYSLQGRLVYDEEFNYEPMIRSDHGLDTGAYLVRISGQKSVYFKKFLVK